MNRQFQSAIANATPDGDGATRELRLAIAGMTCASCSASVERALRRVPGVRDATVNLVESSAFVRIDARSATREPEVIGAIESAGYRATVRGMTAGTEPTDSSLGELRTARANFLLALALSTPWILQMIGMAWGQHISLVWPLEAALALLVLSWPGRAFFVSAWRALRGGRSNMDTLVALGATSAFGYSFAIAANWLPGVGAAHAANYYFESAVFLVLFIALGKWLEHVARGRARAALLTLLDLSPRRARRLTNGIEQLIDARDILVGDRVVVLPGERLPADGVVRKGNTEIDESLLTGEALPVAKAEWDSVCGGTLNTHGRIEIEVTANGSATALAQIVQLVRDAQAHSAPIQRVADRLSAYFVPAVIALAALTLASWLLAGAGLAAALGFAISVVVIACPCALGLATPTAILVGSGMALRHGILIKNGAALELLGRTQLLLLDKTGTITAGKFELVRIDVRNAASTEGAHTERRVLEVAAALERGSNHPLALAIVAAHAAREFDVLTIDAMHEREGLGIEGVVAGTPVCAGRRGFLERAGIVIDIDDARDGGDAAVTAVYVAIGGRHAGTIWLRDRVRPEAERIVRDFRAAGVDIALVTGDRREVGEHVARVVGIDRVHADVLPREKLRIVEEARGAGRIVTMVGDGINDAPALAAAHTGVAMGGGADAAKETGDIVLMRASLSSLREAWLLSRATLRRIRLNLGWALVYNLLGIPIAAGALSGLGIVLRPEFAALAMALSSVSVVASSLALRWNERRIFTAR
ncbi:MAG: heavy metal translocating P-type ATPase [Planctomycetota bacterium]